MSRTNPNQQRAELAAWGLDRLRLTTFHQSVPKAEGWWQAMTGQEPDSSVGKKSGERTEIGQWEGLTLGVQATPVGGRIDWFASEPPGENDDPFLVVNHLPAFVGLANRWLTSGLLPEVTSRLAFGGVVNLPVADPQEGYRRLSDYLPFDIDRTTSSDFFYQLNRRRESVVLPDTWINRLMKWNVGVFYYQGFRLSDSGAVAVKQRSRERCACQLELDINTPSPEEGQVIPRDRLADLFAEMVGLAEEIIREGDTP